MRAQLSWAAVVTAALAACGGDAQRASDSDAADVVPDTGQPDDATGDVSDADAPIDATGDASDDDADACTPGELGCACDADQACGADELVCDGGTCRAAVACAAVVCADHQLCAQAPGLDAACLPACDSGFSWNGGTLTCDANPLATCADSPSDPNAIGDDCRLAKKECVPTSGLVAAHCGDCLAGNVPDAGTNACRAPLGCATVGAECDAQHRLCIAATTSPAADASCGECVLPWVDDDLDPGGTCAVDPLADCTPDGADSYFAVCDALHRECLKTADDLAPSCGDCAGAYAENPATGACAIPSTCADLGCAALGRACTDDGFAACEGCLDGLDPVKPSDPMSACASELTCRDLDCGDDYCMASDTPGIDATCQPSSCGAGQAKNPTTGLCVTCAGSCNKAGETGRFWLDTRSNGSCVCETIPDWYLDTTLGATPKPCDADGDGWVRTAAQPFMEPTGSLDPAIAANARCALHKIDRITLQNEWGQRYEVRLCTGGPVGEGKTCAQPITSSLYEKTELDDEASLTDLVKYPVYGHDGAGRQLHAEEVNPLSKACVSAGGDLDGNGIDDLQEAAEMDIPAGVTLTGLQSLLLDFGYFVELHTSWYEPRAQSEAGTIVIAERSRCAASGDARFVLGYDEASGSSYWKECTRNRRAAFDRSDIQPGFDFARWQCDATSGTCDVPSAPATTTGTTVPDHGLCDVVLPPADGVWRGMTHHSQFRCAQVTSGAATKSYEVARASLYDKSTATAGRYQFDACDVSGSARPHGSANPAAVDLSCTPEVPEAGAVGFIAARYVDDVGQADYSEGCIDEWRSWPELCPGWDTTLASDDQSAVGDGQSLDFGNIVCGCGENYGGLSCQQGCAAADLMLSPGYGVSPRSGWWLCGDLAGSGCSETCADALAVTDFASQTGGWTLGGDAHIVGSVLRVTSDTQGVSGYAWRDAPVYVGGGFAVDFTFQLTASDNAGADGMAFAVQNQGYAAGGELGTGSGLALSFDSFANDATETNRRVALLVNGSSVAHADLAGDWSNSGPHTAHLTYEAGTVKASVDGLASLSYAVDLVAVGAASASGRAYIGFTARTGGFAESHDVSAFAFACGASCESPEQVASDQAGTVWTLEGDVGRFGLEGNALYSAATPCSAVGAEPSARGGGDVCGTTPSTCPGSLTQAGAAAACTALGLRLCTLAELHADEPRSTGCGYDNGRAWSSTACAGGFMTAAGGTQYAATYPDQCTAADGAAVPRCCGDAVPSDPTSGWSLR
ncbi:MAG: L-type lectin-domain containing protein [Myxococcota bacterium]